MTGIGYNAIALAALICGTVLGVTVITTGGSVTEAGTAIGAFTTIAAAVVGRGEKS